MKSRAVTTLLVLIVLTAAHSATWSQARYTITAIGNFYPVAINNSGQVLAHGAYGANDAYLWTPGAQLTTLHGLGAGNTEVYDLNDFGQAVGDSYIASGDLRGVLWSSSGAATALPKNDMMLACGINNSGQIAGIGLRNGIYQATLRDANGDITVLATLPGQDQGQAAAINNNGLVVGQSVAAGGAIRMPVYWSPGSTTPTLMQTLGQTENSPNDVNDNGISVGYATVAPGQARAVRWDANGNIIDLGWRGEALGVNNSGVIVGAQEGWDIASSARIWQNGAMADLNTLIPTGTGWNLWQALGVNDSGVIVGNGSLNGTPYASY